MHAIIATGTGREGVVNGQGSLNIAAGEMEGARIAGRKVAIDVPGRNAESGGHARRD